jgi:signal transduction histidine kinase
MPTTNALGAQTPAEQHGGSAPRGGEERSPATPAGDGVARGDSGPTRSVGTLPSSVIHELRTPLTAIHGYAQVLSRSLAKDPSKARAAGVLLSESTRLAHLFNLLSELAEIESGVPDGQVAETNVREVVDGLVGQKARGHEAHSFRVDGEATVRTDARRLTQALAHVLDNAVAYSPDGGTVRIGIERGPDGVRVAVADEGIGVPTEDAERVFRLYERGSNARRAGVRGLGIGLYVARQALLRVGGQLWHAPGEGAGTVFHVVVPDAE